MTQTIKNIAAALIEAKRNFKPVLKNRTNPHYKSKYADLDSVLDAVSVALGEAGLLLIQPTEISDNGTILKTVLIHAESGDRLESVVLIPSNNDPQKFGSALTYYRRFCLCSLLGIAPEEDDDGNKAIPTVPAKVSNLPPPKPTAPIATQIDSIAERRQALKDCFERLDWSELQQKDWAQTISKKPSKEWDLRVWDAALVDLQERIDKQAATFGKDLHRAEGFELER